MCTTPVWLHRLCIVRARWQSQPSKGINSCNAPVAVICRWDIDDSYAALEKDKSDDAEEQLGSVLPSGAVVATGDPQSGVSSSWQQHPLLCHSMSVFLAPTCSATMA